MVDPHDDPKTTAAMCDAIDGVGPVTTSEQQAVPGAQEAFLDQLRRVNLARYEAWVEGADAGIMFDALELGGEVGELLNVVKKLEREERGWRGSRASPADFADECADVLICLDKLARRRNVDLTAATIAKFNATSEKVDLPHRLTDPLADAGKPIDATQTREAELPADDDELAMALCEAEGHDPHELTYHFIEPGVQEPYGDRWNHYVAQATRLRAALNGRGGAA